MEETPVIEAKANTSTQSLDKPTTDKVLQQVLCLACSKFKSATNLRYSRSKYCTERATEEQPVDIPVPKISTNNDTNIRDKTSLPVRAQKPRLQRTTTIRHTDNQEQQQQHETPPPQNT